jgi:hypothetical protein
MKTPDRTPAPAPAAAPAPPAPRRKRWKKILLVTGIALASLVLAVIVLGPTIIGSVAESKIAQILGEKLNADATVGSVSFGWSGHVVVNDLRVVPKGFQDPLLEVKKVDVRAALFSAIGGRYVADIEVVAPKVIIEKNAEGRFNYEVPPAPPAPPGEASEAGGPKPFVQAALKIRDGEVRVRAKGRETVYTNLALGAKVDSLEKPIDYSLSLDSPAKDRLEVRGSIDLETVSGPATLLLERVSLRNLAAAARAYSDVAELDGTVTGKLDYRLQGRLRFAGKAELEVADLMAVVHDPVLGRDQTIRLDRLRVTHDGTLDEKGNGKHTIVLASGKSLEGRIVVDVTDGFGERRAKTTMSLESDLAAATLLARGLGALPQGMALEGKLSLRGTVDSKGPTEAELQAGTVLPAASWNLELSGRSLGVTMDGNSMRLDQLGLTDQGSMDPKGNARSQIALSSGKALAGTVATDVRDLLGAGRTVQAKIDLQSDLAELGKVVEKLVGIKPGMALEGKARLAGSAEVRGAGDLAKADLDLRADDLVAIDTAGGNKRYELDRSIAAKLSGSWDGKSRTGIADAVTLASSFASLDARGGVALGGNEPEIKPSSVKLAADLAKLGSKLESFMTDPPRLGGTVTVDAKYEGDKVTVDAVLKALRVTTKEVAKVDGKDVVRERAFGPIDATLRDEGKADKSWNGRHLVSLKSGKALDLALSADLKDALKPDRAVLAALKLESDLGALAAMLPGLVELKPGTEIAGAASLGGKVETRGSAFAKFDLAAALSNLVAVEKATKKAQEIDRSITAKAAGEWDGKKKAVDLRTLSIGSSFGAVDSKGGFVLDPFAVRESSLVVKGLDLEKLGAKLALFMENPPGLAGRVEVQGTYARDQYTLAAEARGVRVTTKETVREGGKEVVRTSTIGPVDAKVDQKGTFSAAKDGGLKIESSRVTAGVPGAPVAALDVALSGEVRKVMDDAREGGLKLEAALQPVEATKLMPDLGLGGPPVKLTASLGLKPDSLTLSGRTKLEGLTITTIPKEPPTPPPVKPITRTAKTGPLDFSVELKKGAKGQEIAARAGTALFEWLDNAYAAKGGFSTDVIYKDDVTTGTTKISNLEVVDEKKNVVKEPEVELRHDVKLGSLYLRNVELKSGFARGTVKGNLLERGGKRVFEGLEARLFYHPDRLGAVLKPWLPGKLEGAEEKSLVVVLNGEASADTALALLRGIQGDVDVDLAKFTTANGISVSGKTQARLKEGILSSGTPLAVNKGQTRLSAAIDFREAKAQPRSTLTFNAKDVDANAKMDFLEGINPIFHTVDGAVDGQINSDFNFSWTGPVDPHEKDWQAATRERLTGGGVFGVRNLNVVGSPTVKDLMAALGEPNALQGELLPAQVVIANGICSYKDMTLRAKRYELRFTGWVDCVGDARGKKKMDLTVDMPFTEHLVKSKPGLSRYMGQRFTVKLTGTVDKPRLDIEGMLVEYAKRAIEGTILDKAEDLFKKLLDPKKK